MANLLSTSITGTLSTTGNTGIGTASPSAESNLSLGSISGSEGGHLTFFKGTSFSHATHLDNYSDSFRIMYGTNASSAAVQFILNHGTGNVGIGTVNPLYKLDVAGAVRLTGSLVFDDLTSNLIQHRAGNDVNTLVTVGHGGFDHNGYLRIGGADVATRSWVQAQGYLTSETDSQTLDWEAGNKNLSISNGNTVTLDGLATEEFVTSQGYLTSLPAHTHTIANVTGLQTALDSKATTAYVDNAVANAGGGGGSPYVSSVTDEYVVADGTPLENGAKLVQQWTASTDGANNTFFSGPVQVEYTDEGWANMYRIYFPYSQLVGWTPGTYPSVLSLIIDGMPYNPSNNGSFYFQEMANELMFHWYDWNFMIPPNPGEVSMAIGTSSYKTLWLTPGLYEIVGEPIPAYSKSKIRIASVGSRAARVYHTDSTKPAFYGGFLEGLSTLDGEYFAELSYDKRSYILCGFYCDSGLYTSQLLIRDCYVGELGGAYYGSHPNAYLSATVYDSSGGYYGVRNFPFPMSGSTNATGNIYSINFYFYNCQNFNIRPESLALSANVQGFYLYDCIGSSISSINIFDYNTGNIGASYNKMEFHNCNNITFGCSQNFVFPGTMYFERCTVTQGASSSTIGKLQVLQSIFGNFYPPGNAYNQAFDFCGIQQQNNSWFIQSHWFASNPAGLKITKKLYSTYGTGIPATL